MDGCPSERSKNERETPAAAAATQAAYAAAAAVTARLASSAQHTDVCIVCLQTCSSKACACSFMHAQCAASYASTYGSSCCRICSGKFDSSKLSKRPRESDEDCAMERKAHKKLQEREASERSINLEWARRVAPCAAQILFRHFQHVRNESTQQQTTTELSFEAIILSLLFSGPEYLDDLSERLSDVMPSVDVERHVRRLHSIGELLTSPERVGEECMSEFMRLFNMHFDRRLLSGHLPVGGPAHVIPPVQSMPA